MTEKLNKIEEHHVQMCKIDDLVGKLIIEIDRQNFTPIELAIFFQRLHHITELNRILATIARPKQNSKRSGSNSSTRIETKMYDTKPPQPQDPLNVAAKLAYRHDRLSNQAAHLIRDLVDQQKRTEPLIDNSTKLLTDAQKIIARQTKLTARLVELITRMRDAQMEYFSTHSHQALVERTRLEHAVDEILETLKNHDDQT